jgi:hypothetical protein
MWRQWLDVLVFENPSKAFISPLGRLAQSGSLNRSGFRSSARQADLARMVDREKPGFNVSWFHGFKVSTYLELNVTLKR